MQLFLGIDGGGTRTTAWLSDERGGVLARALTGPSNPLKVGFEASERELLRAVRDALRSAGLPQPQVGVGFKPTPTVSKISRRTMLSIEAVVVGLAGVDRPPVHARLLRWLRKAIPARKHLLTSDAAIALEAALGDSPGIIVISGTGSIAYARDSKRRALRSGGWGVPFDDVGSGYDLGRMAIVAALRDYDGRGEHTLLGGKIRRALRLRDITQIILKPLTPQKIAALFPLVLEAARQGDFAAEYMLDLAAQELSELALALVERLGWKRREFSLVCAGGVFTASARIRQSFASFVRSSARRARVVQLRRAPVEGALALARRLVLGSENPE